MLANNRLLIFLANDCQEWPGPCKEFYLKTCLFQQIGVVKKYDFVLEEEEDSWPQTPGEPKYIKIHSSKKQTALSVGKKPL